MRGILVRFLAATLLGAGCGGSSTSSTPTAEPTESTTASATVPSTDAMPATPTETDIPRSTETASASTMPPVPTTGDGSPPPTEAPPPTTSVDQTNQELAVLRPGGVGEVDFGTPADETVRELSALLGPPDRVDVMEPIGEGCVEGASWLDCLRERRVVDEGRLAVWTDWGLSVALVDTAADYGPSEPAALRFADWHAAVAPGSSRLETAEGLYPGMTVGALRQVGSGVRFGYNEGLLDRVDVSFGDRGGYWGRLDWDPSTNDVEYWDVSAMQAALNEHGANLVVDGEWGPRSEAAWLEFLTEHGVEPNVLAAQWPVWLTPEIGEALELPPDAITVATLGPRPATDTVPVSLPILRPAGLDRFDFGDPADELVPELEALLGPPTDDTSYTPDGDEPFGILPSGYWAAYELRFVEWTEPDLSLVLSDIGFVDGEWTPTPGTLTLVSWSTSSPRLRLANGLGVGSPLVDLQVDHPQIGYGTWDVCESEYNPAAFSDTPPSGRGLRGATDWDWVSDLQAALVDRGASLAVDGAYGPRTQAAVEAFQREIGAHHPDGFVDPEVVAALRLQAPSNATITRLEAGYPGSC